MFSALKRLAGKGDGPVQGNSSGPSHHAMSHSLQRRFARGVQYNMKIIIKGDRNVGKTCLFQRLQGQKFVEEYIPTEEIQVASIQWSYKATDDVVKVEVWDVVDRGKKKRVLGGLKLDNISAIPVLPDEEQPALDAEFLDVYKNTNGVIIMMDITKSWTFDYVQRELPKVPNHIPVLVLANHCDMAHHRTVTGDHVTYFIDTLNRPEGSAQVRYAEGSMRNGFGLKLLHKFFNLPFLQLQRETLLRQLETNDAEIRSTNQELDLYQESDDADYNKFLEQLMNRRRQAAEMSSNAVAAAANLANAIPKTPSPSPLVKSIRPSHSSHQLHQPSNHMSGPEGANTLTRSATIIGPIGGGNPIPNFNSTPLNPSRTAFTSSTPNPSPPRASAAAAVVLPTQSSIQSPQEAPQGDAKQTAGFMSKIFGNKIRDGQEDTSERRPSVPSNSASSSIATPEPITSVEEFVPDGGMLDRSFLEDAVDNPSPAHHSNHDGDSESDSEGNPLVAGFQDDLDPDDVLPSKEVKTHSFVPQNDGDIIQSPSLSKKESLSSLNDAKDNDTATDPELSITADALDSWLGGGMGARWGRCSPEGGSENEDNKNVCLELMAPPIPRSGSSSPLSSHATSNAKELNKKKKKEKEREKGEEKKKHKKKSKDKLGESSEEGRKSKKKSGSGRRQSREESARRNELEDFLNRPSGLEEGFGGVDAAYEAI